MAEAVKMTHILLTSRRVSADAVVTRDNQQHRGQNERLDYM